MKKTAIIIISSYLLLVVIGIVSLSVIFFSRTPLIKPVQKESKITTASDGTEFKIFLREDNFPDQEITIIAYMNEKEIFSYYGFSNFLSYYDYDTAFDADYAEIIEEYQNGDIKAYEFHWGIIYTADGENYTGSAKHEYYETMENDPVFEEVYYGLGNTEQPVSRVGF